MYEYFVSQKMKPFENKLLCLTDMNRKSYWSIKLFYQFSSEFGYEVIEFFYFLLLFPYLLLHSNTPNHSNVFPKFILLSGMRVFEVKQQIKQRLTNYFFFFHLAVV